METEYFAKQCKLNIELSSSSANIVKANILIIIELEAIYMINRQDRKSTKLNNFFFKKDCNFSSILLSKTLLIELILYSRVTQQF